MVSRMPAVARILLLLLVVSAPLVTVGACFWGWGGAAGGFVLADVLLILAALTSERVIIGMCRAATGGSRAVPDGLETTLRRTHADLVSDDAFGYALPRVLVYPDPLPNALTVRSIGSSGTVLLSQGLLAALSESSLRAVLRESIRRNEESEWLLNSLCASLATHAFRLFPKPWRNLLFSGAGAGALPSGPGGFGVISLLPVLWLLPWTRLLLALCGRVSVLEPAGSFASVQLAIAMRKTGMPAAKAGHNPVPGAAPLFLVGPGPAERLL